jgi:hypothetical protein
LFFVPFVVPAITVRLKPDTTYEWPTAINAEHAEFAEKNSALRVLRFLRSIVVVICGPR